MSNYIYMGEAEIMEGLASAIGKLEDYFSKLDESEIKAIKAARNLLEEEVFRGGYYDDNGKWHDDY